MDTRSVEKTIAVGQNMQKCHSLRCKQIVDGNPIDIDSMPARNVSSREFRLILVAAAHAYVTELAETLKV